MRRPWEWLCPLVLLIAPAMAQDVPPPLKDWQDWVLHEVPEHACPVLVGATGASSARQCAWPGRLALDAGKDGARFGLDIHVDGRSWVNLPGDTHNWPQQVTANGKPVAVLDRDHVPTLLLERGDYALRGVLPWDSRPASLHVPASIGLVSLTLDGHAVERIERNGEALTLGEAAATQRAADALSLRVYRRLQDGLPSDLQTQLHFKVTGTAREQVLGPVLPKGFVATFIEGGLPARLESDGRLRVQLRAGEWTMTLGARSADTLTQVHLSLPGEPWPPQEIWSYADDPSLRSTRVQGQLIDAGQAEAPGAWSDLPTYALDTAHGLDIEQITRGGEGGLGDQLTLHRQLWLDFDGKGFTALDHLTGTLRRSQRLDVTAPWHLQSASLPDFPLLVTDDGHGPSGVELRDTTLNLQAALRLPERGGAPSAGWLAAMESIEATLHLPYGYRLLGAVGADRSPDSWVAQWSLLDLFVVALIALLAGRLLGWPWGMVAVVFLALAQHENGAPRWTLALALALALLMNALSEGRLRLLSRVGATALLALVVVWTLPFAATQMNEALHPQLQGGSVGAGVAPAGGFTEEAVSEETAPAALADMSEASSNAAPAEPAAPVAGAPAPPPPPAPPADVARSASKDAVAAKVQQSQKLETVTVTGSMINIGQLPDDHNTIQAGRGVPHWDVGNNYRLGWSGPVTAEQTTRLVIVPAWLVRVLRVAMLVALVVLLGKLALRLVPPSREAWRGGRVPGGVAALLALALLPHGVHAQSVPTEELLTQLRHQLTEAPSCAPTCVAVAQASVQANADYVLVDMEMHAAADLAVPLPLGGPDLLLQAVSADNRDAVLTRNGDGVLVKLERGVHHVVLRYSASSTDVATLHFPLRPQRLVFNGNGWKPDGVVDGRLLGDSLTLNRVREAGDGSTLNSMAQAFPPYVKITRTIVLGSEWTVRNEVERIAPREGGFTLELPLLAGEHPLRDDVQVHDGRIAVTFNAGDRAVYWQSRLDRRDAITLTAPPLADRAEVWLLQSATMWHLDTKGVPASQDAEGLRYRPLPGESLQVTVSQPKAAAGDSLAFDEVFTQSEVGDRTTETLVHLVIRSTRGGEHAITLPPGTQLLEATRDYAPLSLAIHDDKLSLPLLPGTHRYIMRVREPQGASFATRTPAFDLGAAAANISLRQMLPGSRWVLWTWGPTDGPAVLYWSQLLVLLVAAGLLARYAPTPLRFHHWLLLGLGFSAFAWGAYALVVAWLIALGLRSRHAVPERFGARFNLMQCALASLTLLAIVVLICAVPTGLLGLPDMHVSGNDSTAWQLNWFADQSDSVLPQGGVLSVSLWVYKIAMLLWALWLANALIGWLRWGFEAWSKDGYWRARKSKLAEPPPVPEATP